MEKEYLTFSRKVLLVVILLFFASVANATTYTVNSTADANDTNLNDNTCAAVVFGATVCTLRAAIQQANAHANSGNAGGANDVIEIPTPGVYAIQAPGGMMMGGGGPGGPAAAQPFSITEGVDIMGGVGNRATTIIAANGNNIRTFVISAPDAVNISHVTIQNGNTPVAAIGGGVQLNNATLAATFSDVTIRNSTATAGGGLLWTAASSVTIDNSTIENNRAAGNATQGQGGGINSGPGDLTITNSTIRNNTAVFGGGIFTTGNIMLDSSTISGNTATAAGFGGGGISVGSTSAGSLIAVNSTISGNMSLVSGAGLLMVNGTASLYNTTIAANEADSDNNGTGLGGGITGSTSTPTPSVTIANSLIAGNISFNDVGVDCDSDNLTISSSGFNLIGNNANCTVDATDNQIGTPAAPIDPVISALSDNGGPTLTHRLLTGSPAIDGGNPSGCLDNNGMQLTVDQRGEARGGAANPTCDIGAVEMTTVANAGPDQIVLDGTHVTLDGSASYAASGITSYSWAQVGTSTVTLTTDPTFASPIATFTATAPTTPATLTFELTITDNDGISSTDRVQVIVHQAPVANAGPDQVVNYSDAVKLSAAASTDDGSIVDYEWSQISGSTIAIIKDPVDPAAATFIAPDVPGPIEIQLTVTDNYGVTASDTMMVTVNEPPTANAGADQTATAGDMVTLTGTGTDPDGDAANLTYAWSQVITGTEDTVTLTPSTSDPATVTFTAPATAQTLTFQLTVKDPYGASATDIMVVAVGVTPPPPPAANEPPVANAGKNLVVSAGDMGVQLTGTDSTDDHGIVSYLWEQLDPDNNNAVIDPLAPNAVTINNADAVIANFDVPADMTPQWLTFQLTVKDAAGLTSMDTVIVGVDAAVPGANIPPVATITAQDPVNPVDYSAVVTLTGVGTDADIGDTITAYNWVQTAGETVDLDTTDPQHPKFTAPATDVTLKFELTVTDSYGTVSAPYTVSVIVGKGTNKPPIADAGADRTVIHGALVELDGSASYDPNKDPLKYEWKQTGGTQTVTLDINPTDPSKVTFYAPMDNDTLVFQLIVTDDQGSPSTPATVTITVGTATASTSGSGKPGSGPAFGGGGSNSGGGGGALGLSVLLLALLVTRR